MTASTQHELVLVREFDAPREKIYKAWTDPDLLKQWFVPRPWGVAEAKLDVRPGGSSVVVMQDPRAISIRTMASISRSSRTRRSFSPMPIPAPGCLPRNLSSRASSCSKISATVARNIRPRRCTGAPRTRRRTRRWVPRRMGQGCGPTGGVAGEDVSGAVRRCGETASS